MKVPTLFTTFLYAATASAAALPVPASEADVENLRARGVSEHDIALSFPLGHSTPTLFRRAIDADAEVAPGSFAAPAPQIRRSALTHPNPNADADADADAAPVEQSQSQSHDANAKRDENGNEHENEEGQELVQWETQHPEHKGAIMRVISDLLEGRLGVSAMSGSAKKKRAAKRNNSGEDLGGEVVRPVRWDYRW